MEKEVSEMTLAELWELFPIFLVQPSDRWISDFEGIEIFLKKVLLDCSVKRISHIGSTAIHGIWAKDIVDVLIEVSKRTTLESVAKVIEQSGFIRMSTESNRISFNKGYTSNGFADKVYHVHLRYEGDNNELYFRDYLNEHPDVAKDYERLKLALWKKYEHNRNAYTNAKTDFIKKWTNEARKLYRNRY